MKFDGDIWGGMYWEQLTKHRLKDDKCLEKYGYKVYSQNDEDGIIQEIFKRIGTTNKTFIEFGVQDGLESNGHYLLHRGWNGLWIEGDYEYCETIKIKFNTVLETKQLKLINKFITKENINSIINESEITGEIDLLSIDIDGNDYYVWETINAVNPRVVCIEYNGKFPADYEWKQAYNSFHCWHGDDWHGASLKAFEILGRKKGYTLVGTNINGANAFFVKDSLVGDKFYKPATSEGLYNPLRLNMFHRNGHPANYCLINQKDNFGVFNYFKNKKLSANFGFHNKEEDNNGEFRWMSNNNAQILINKSNCGNLLKLKYFHGIPLEKYNEHLLLKIQLDGQKFESIEIENTEGIIELDLSNLKDRDAISKCDLSISYLWRPSDFSNSQDNRELGLAFYFE